MERELMDEEDRGKMEWREGKRHSHVHIVCPAKFWKQRPVSLQSRMDKEHISVFL